MDTRVKFFVAVVSLLLLAAATYAASNAPLSGEWNIRPSGTAASNGELVFRMTPGDTEQDPVEVTVFVRSGTSDVAVARDIRQALSNQLRRDRFNVTLGEGANVLVTDSRGQPNFSLELLDSDIDNLRVAVQAVEPAASPTVPAQSAPPAVPAPRTPASPGDVTPPAGTPPPTPEGTPVPGTAGQPASSPPADQPAPPPR
jgi:hypothetical protein